MFDQLNKEVAFAQGSAFVVEAARRALSCAVSDARTSAIATLSALLNQAESNKEIGVIIPEEILGVIMDLWDISDVRTSFHAWFDGLINEAIVTWHLDWTDDPTSRRAIRENEGRRLRAHARRPSYTM